FEGARAIIPLHLESGATETWTISVAVRDEPLSTDTASLESRPRVSHLAHEDTPLVETGMARGTVRIETSNELFNRVLRRSFLDLAMLETQHGEDRFFAAGVPWFVALFGRDSLITALQTL